MSTPSPTQHAAVLQQSVANGVMVLTLNRPSARNALSPDLVEALDAALTRLRDDDEVRVAILTGSGPAFCAGLDLKVYANDRADRRRVAAVIRRVGQLPKPIIGAVNGPAVAGGFELALGCDWLIGTPAAAFADTHVKIGAFPGGGTTARLARVIGLSNAKAVSLGGMRIGAEAALRWGLLSELVDAELLMPRAHELADFVAGANQDLVRTVRGLYDDNEGRSLPEALDGEQACLEQWRTRQPREWSV